MNGLALVEASCRVAYTKEASDANVNMKTWVQLHLLRCITPRRENEPRGEIRERQRYVAAGLGMGAMGGMQTRDRINKSFI
jgi:hypothetical protein